MTEPQVLILANRDDLVAKATKLLSERISKLVFENKEFHIAITGGTVGTLVLQGLAGSTKNIDLSKLHIWWVDERYIANQSLDRNELQARGAWLSGSSIVESNIHAFPASESGSIEDAAKAFSAEIEKLSPKFEIVLLGMGEDGHVASLFPGSQAVAFGDWVVVENNSPKPPKQRLSLSEKALNNSKEVYFLVSGEEKAAAVSEVFNGNSNLPAAGVSGLNKTFWLLDEEAASGIISS